MIAIKCIILSKSQVSPVAVSAKYECPSCGNFLNMLLLEGKFREPSKCGCGRKGKFRLISKELVDCIDCVCEDLPESMLADEQPGRLRVLIQGPLVSEEHYFSIGARVLLVGVLVESPILLKTGGQSTKYDFLFKLNSIQSLELFSFDGQVSDAEKLIHDKIRNSTNPAKVIRSMILPDHVGDDFVAEACIYQQFSGTFHEGTKDFLHILLVGDPATNKTGLSSRIAEINPISKFSSGPEVSRAGLIAAALRDPLTGGYVGQCGILPRASGGVAHLDELEKMADHDKVGLHTPMSKGVAYKNVGGLDLKLITATSILATANPKVGKNLEHLDENHIDLANTILSRFDLVYVMRDKQDAGLDEEIATCLFDKATCSSKNTTSSSKNTTSSSINTSLNHKNIEENVCIIKKYVFLQKKFKSSIPFSRNLKKHTIQWYVSVRGASKNVPAWAGKKVDPRSMQAILILARAIARDYGLHPGIH